MSFTSRVENVYLTILRLVMLAAATLAIAASIVIALSSATKLMQPTPRDDVSPLIKETNSPKLDGYLSTMTQTNSPTQQMRNNEVKEDESVNKDLEAAAVSLRKYVEGVYDDKGTKLTFLRRFFLERSSGMQQIYKDEYYKSVNIFIGELLKKMPEQKIIVQRAKVSGQPLYSVKGYIDPRQALDWHLDQFRMLISERGSDNSKRQNKYMEDHIKGMKYIQYALYSFGAFLGIVFLFIIIKIERNLRAIAETKQS